MPDELVYERELRVLASPQTLFELLTDPNAFCSWMGVRAEFDARPGGGFRVDFGSGATVCGEFLEVTPYERVVFSWGFEGDVIPLAPGRSRVEFTLIPDGDQTLVRLRHSGLSPPLVEFHAWGWERYVPRLVATSEGRDPGADPMQAGPPPAVVRRLLERVGAVR